MIIKLVFILIFIIFITLYYNDKKEHYRGSLDVFYKSVIDSDNINNNNNIVSINNNLNIYSAWEYGNYYLITNIYNDKIYITLIYKNIGNNTNDENTKCLPFTNSYVANLDINRKNFNNIKLLCHNINDILFNGSGFIDDNKLIINNIEYNFISKLDNSKDVNNFIKNIPNFITNKFDAHNYLCNLDEKACKINKYGDEYIACSTKINDDETCINENIKCSLDTTLKYINIGTEEEMEEELSICNSSYNNIEQGYNNIMNVKNINYNYNYLNNNYLDELIKYKSILIYYKEKINDKYNYWCLNYLFLGINNKDNSITCTEFDKINYNNKIQLWNIYPVQYNNTLFYLGTNKEKIPIYYPVFNNNGTTSISLFNNSIEQHLLIENIEIEDNIFFTLSCKLRSSNGLYLSLENNIISYMGNNTRKITLLSQYNSNNWYICGLNTTNIKYIIPNIL